MCQVHGAEQIINQETLQCHECKTNTKLVGKIYAFSGTIATPIIYNKNGIREPDNLTDTNCADNDTILESETWTEEF